MYTKFTVCRASSFQTYERRKKYTKNAEEKRLLEKIAYKYMTEESESDGTVRQHELTRRSKGI